MAIRKGGLGAGLDALFDDNISDVQVKKTLRTMDIEPNRFQPRKNFDDDSIAELAVSVQKFGIIQPVVVKPMENGSYCIVAGERRWRAARLIGLEEIPVIIREFSESEAMQVSLIENIMRKDLNPIEEANGYKELIEKYNMTHEKISEVFGCSRPYITNSLRLLTLPHEILELVENGKISTGHAKVLLSCENRDIMIKLALQCAEDNLTVKQLEKLVKNISAQPKPEKTIPKDSYFREMELSLNEILGRKVSIKSDKKGHGTLVLEFYDKEDLSAIADRLADMSSSNK